MKVVYYYVAQTPEDPLQRILAAIAFASVRKHMKGAWIIHLAENNSGTLPLHGCDEFKEVHAKGRVACSAEIQEPALFLDTDMVVQEDIRPAFDPDTTELVVVDRLGSKSRRWNGGFVWAKNPPAFFNEIAARMDGQDVEGAFCDAVKSQKFVTKSLQNRYNCIAEEGNKDNWKSQAVLHFKGGRKPLMIESFI